MSSQRQPENCPPGGGRSGASSPAAGPGAPGWPRSLQILVKPSGSACNLRCDYCFYLDKSRLYPDVAAAAMRMDPRVHESFVDQLMDGQLPGAGVTISWQGGEPTLMGLDFFRRAVRYARERAPTGAPVGFTLQTNGTLLDAEWCRFLRDEQVLVGLSVDGPPELHDTYRRDARGRGTFARVARAAELLKEHEVDVNALCSVHAANAEHPREVYAFLRDDLGMDWIQFIPIVERVNDDGSTLLQQGSRVTGRSVSPNSWGAFLLAVFDDWLQTDVERVHVSIFESAFASWVGVPALMCVFAETCGEAPVLEHNGDLYACDHFVEPDHLLGTITETPLRELVASDQQRRFGAAKRDALPRVCRECDVRFACNGECPKNRFVPAPDGEPGLNYLCEGYAAFFRGIDAPMRLMARLYRAGRAPAEVMRLLPPGFSVTPSDDGADAAAPHREPPP